MRSRPRVLLQHLAWSGVVVLAGLSAHSASAQMGPVPVSYATARSSVVKAQVELSGTVEARRAAVVASEVSGVVIELSAREGDRVNRGAPLARLRKQNLDLDLDRVRAELREAQARLDLAEHRRSRSQELFDAGVVSRQDLDDTVSEAEAWSGRVEQAQADIAKLEDEVAQSVIRAPFAGVVVSEGTEVGEWISVGGPVAELVDLSRLEVRVNVPENHFSSIVKGSQAKVSFESIPGLSALGTVVARVPRANAQTRTFPVIVTIDRPSEEMGVGMLAQVVFAAGSGDTATLVPKDALVDSNGEKVVYLLDSIDSEEGSEPQAVVVKVGLAMGSWLVVEGVEPGQRVITRGNERLFPGVKVVGEEMEYEAP